MRVLTSVGIYFLAILQFRPGPANGKTPIKVQIIQDDKPQRDSIGVGIYLWMILKEN
jgi:hypothetical protein